MKLRLIFVTLFLNAFLINNAFSLEAKGWSAWYDYDIQVAVIVSYEDTQHPTANGVHSSSWGSWATENDVFYFRYPSLQYSRTESPDFQGDHLCVGANLIEDFTGTSWNDLEETYTSDYAYSL